MTRNTSCPCEPKSLYIPTHLDPDNNGKNDNAILTDEVLGSLDYFDTDDNVYNPNKFGIETQDNIANIAPQF